ncbi:MAG: YihY/virulence factor BrkB family protein [Geodermatophilaceae bacterium]
MTGSAGTGQPSRPGIWARVMAAWRGQRARRPWLNHVVRAASLYGNRQADLLAAGATYFAFLAVFPLILLVLAVAGAVLSSRPDLLAHLLRQIQVAVPGDLGRTLIDTIDTVRAQRGTVGVVGLLGLLYAGLGWMSKLRVAMQTIWRGQPDEPNFVKDNIRDVLNLVGLGGALLASVLLTGLANGLTGFVIDFVGLTDVPGVSVLTRLLGILIAIAGSTLIFLWLFIRFPQVDVPVRAVLPGAVFGAVGFEILKLVGTFYLAAVSRSPAALAFGTLTGLLIWIYFSSRFLLFAAAWTATLSRVVERIRADAELNEPAAAVVEGPRVPPLHRPVEGGPSTGAVAAGLVGAGAVVGVVAPVAVRSWWRRGRARSAR